MISLGEYRTSNCLTYAQRLFNKISPLAIRLFICLAIISAIGIVSLAVISHSHHEQGEKPNFQAFRHPQT